MVHGFLFNMYSCLLLIASNRLLVLQSFAVALLVLGGMDVHAQPGGVNSPYAELLDTPSPAPYPSTATPDALPGDLGGLLLGSPQQVDLSPAAAPAQQVIVELTPAEAAAVEASAEPAAPPLRWYHPTYWFQPPDWDTGVELGLNGASGTSNSFSLRTGAYIKRENKKRKVDFSIYHNRTKAAGVETQNNAQMKFRHDWLFAESPWTIYFQNQLYYDEFQAFDLNLNLNAGVGYRFIKNDWTELTGRFGSGASREFGGVSDDWIPEAQFGIDYEQKVTATQKFYATVDYFPEWAEFGNYRLLTDIGYEVELVVPSNVSLKFAATDRYDSSPDGVDPHNLNYSVLLLWKL